MKKELGKVLIDIAKLVIGGVILCRTNETGHTAGIAFYFR